MKKKLFDFVIGNPPYNDDFENSGENGNYAKPVYHQFLDAAYEVGNKVELIHPARFLFNAGSTPKEWNNKRLNDTHFKILFYESNSNKVFFNTDIKGGIAISYHDESKEYEPIGTFTPFSELNNIVKKCKAVHEINSLSSNIYTQIKFNLEKLYIDYPEYKRLIGSNGKDRRLRNNIFEKIPIFTAEQTNPNDIKVLGVIKNKRIWRFIPIKYIDVTHENLDKWKVLCPRANGAGIFGETLSSLVIAKPMIGYTQTFIGIGAFNTKFEAESLMKYIKSKFARCLLDVLKVTQDNDRGVWRLIPMQNFSASSDIDWSKSIHEIDLQLYRKYGLDDKEIEFIETHVKEMA
jgi:hypothetical protein